MKRLFFLAFVPLTGCASFQSAYEPPIVDMRGVDAQKYAYDLGQCTDAARNGPALQFGAPISRCLTERGYTVTIAKS